VRVSPSAGLLAAGWTERLACALAAISSAEIGSETFSWAAAWPTIRNRHDAAMRIGYPWSFIGCKGMKLLQGDQHHEILQIDPRGTGIGLAELIKKDQVAGANLDLLRRRIDIRLQERRDEPLLEGRRRGRHCVSIAQHHDVG